jgi:hypothetical protein
VPGGDVVVSPVWVAAAACAAALAVAGDGVLLGAAFAAAAVWLAAALPTGAAKPVPDEAVCAAPAVGAAAALWVCAIVPDVALRCVSVLAVAAADGLAAVVPLADPDGALAVAGVAADGLAVVEVADPLTEELATLVGALAVPAGAEIVPDCAIVGAPVVEALVLPRLGVASALAVAPVLVVELVDAEVDAEAVADACMPVLPLEVAVPTPAARAAGAMESIANGVAATTSASALVVANDFKRLRPCIITFLLVWG